MHTHFPMFHLVSLIAVLDDIVFEMVSEQRKRCKEEKASKRKKQEKALEPSNFAAPLRCVQRL